VNILVVEDDPVSRRILGGMLVSLDHQVLVAEDGDEAWRLLTAEAVDVVVTDWMMPRVDGLELTRRIRGRSRDRYLWVLLLTVLSGKGCFLDAMQAGADDFMSKPVDIDELMARLRVAERILGLQRAVRQLEGLLPICAYCKRIRDEGDSWSQVEEYVSRRTEAQFSHGICPACYDRHVKPQLESIKGVRS
jgi:phosphoserine phosphatase RsbU/P